MEIPIIRTRDMYAYNRVVDALSTLTLSDKEAIINKGDELIYFINDNAQLQILMHTLDNIVFKLSRANIHKSRTDLMYTRATTMYARYICHTNRHKMLVINAIKSQDFVIKYQIIFPQTQERIYY